VVSIAGWEFLAGERATGAAVGSVAATIPLASAPSAGLTALSTAVWIPGEADGAVSRLDPDTNQIAATIQLGATPTCSLCWGAVAADERSVWTTSRSARLAVVEIDPLKNHVIASLPVSVFPSAVAIAGDGTLWLASVLDSAVLRFDPRAHRQLASVTVPRASRLAVGDTAVWVLTQRDGSARGSVARIDTRTNQVVANVEVGSHPTALALGEGSLWVVDEGTQSLRRIDPLTNTVVASITVGFLPTGVVAGNGSVWVISQSAPTIRGPALSRIDPISNTVTGSMALGEGSPIGVAMGAGSLWVANRSPDPSRIPNTVIRVDPLTTFPASAHDALPWVPLALAAMLVCLLFVLVQRILVKLSFRRNALALPSLPRAYGAHMSDLRRFAQNRARTP
jgi:virginiamycin B lyase